jgi:hypothetical protein
VVARATNANIGRAIANQQMPRSRAALLPSTYTTPLDTIRETEERLVHDLLTNACVPHSWPISLSMMRRGRWRVYLQREKAIKLHDQQRDKFLARPVSL